MNHNLFDTATTLRFAIEAKRPDLVFTSGFDSVLLEGYVRCVEVTFSFIHNDTDALYPRLTHVMESLYPPPQEPA